VQLDDALADLTEARDTSRGHVHSIQTKGRQFQRDQADIDRRLQLVTAADSSDEAVRRFEASMAKLGQLDITVGYIDLLKTVDALQYSPSPL
jgi:RAD50-interacting protein 1